MHRSVLPSGSCLAFLVPLVALPCTPTAAAQDANGNLETRVKSLEEQLRELRQQSPPQAAKPAEGDLRVFW
jgi:hypothetical protein